MELFHVHVAVAQLMFVIYVPQIVNAVQPTVIVMQIAQAVTVILVQRILNVIVVIVT